MTSALHTLTLHADISYFYSRDDIWFLPCPGEASGINNWKASQETCFMLVT